jgi:hypothetical protein
MMSASDSLENHGAADATLLFHLDASDIAHHLDEHGRIRRFE